MNNEIEYNNNIIRQFGEHDFTAYVGFVDDDGELDIHSRTFKSLSKAKKWIDSQVD